MCLSIGSEWEIWNGYIVGAALRAANIFFSIQNSEQNARESLSIQSQLLKTLSSSRFISIDPFTTQVNFYNRNGNNHPNRRLLHPAF